MSETLCNSGQRSADTAFAAALLLYVCQSLLLYFLYGGNNQEQQLLACYVLFMYSIRAGGKGGWL